LLLATKALYHHFMSTIGDIGTHLVVLRRTLGLTQGELAGRLGVKRQQVQRWESNAYRSASLERVARVADALGWADTTEQIAAEVPAAYGGSGITGLDASPVRDLGEIIVRVRASSHVLSERFGVRSVAIFGSFARGQQGAASDVDALLELADPSMESQFGAERELERILGRSVESGTLASVNPRVRESVESEMVRVWPA
jgi:predicted nucleotidyltransferase/DNA-binding XRE family transcriptional regulator